MSSQNSKTFQLNSKQLLEVGCGVGNFVFPLVKETSDDTFFQVCDFSPRAIDFVKVGDEGGSLMMLFMIHSS